MKTSPRSNKLATIVQENLPAIIQKYLTPNQIGFLTITGVEISGDLGIAHIFFTTIGGATEAEKYLKKVSKKIVYDLLKIVKLRREIVLIWKKDNTGKIISQMDRLNPANS